MAKYRNALPQLGDALFLGDGGLETTLIFHEEIELPCFASFGLLLEPDGRATLERYYRGYAALARRFGRGLVLESATWRCNPDWGERLGHGPDALAEANRQSIRLIEAVRDEFETSETPIVLSGCLGPRGDGYVADARMTADEAADYHAAQIATFASTAADLVSAFTLNYVEEAAGIALAARDAGMPVVLSFTLETDGRLPTGQPLGEAIERVDRATDRYPAYYMINCAHPTHFEAAVPPDAPWIDRLRGVRANASRMSHAELDEAPELDIGDPAELGGQIADLKRRLPALSVLGGCCGTDERHVEQIATACRRWSPPHSDPPHERCREPARRDSPEPGR